jgi:signal transduction histidine kinase
MLIPERTRADLHQAVARFAAGPNTARRLDKGEPLVCLRKNGDEFPTETAISKLEVGGHKILTATIRDVTQERRVEREQRFLAEVGPVLASSLEYEKTLDRVAELAVREIADLCIVDIVSIDGQIRRLEAVCRDPAKKWIADGLKRAALDPGSPFLTKSAFADQEPLLIERVSNHTVASFAQNAEHLNLLRALDIKSLITVPLVTHRKLVGAIALVASASSRRFGPADLRLAQELAHRAALAIENARLYKVAQIAIQARDELAGVVAHDLRNPLNAIGLQADTLDDRKVGDGIRYSVTRMNRIIQDLLDVTQLEAGQLSVERSRLSMTEFLLDLVEAQRPLADKRRLALLLEIPPDLPEVLADRDRLLQIFENLISNAIKFTRHGSVTVGAVARDGELEIWVRDTGMGLAAESLPHLFDRFWQADKAARHGAGLGLPIVKGLVEAHGGRVWVESAPGAGFCFYFTIPQAPPSVETRDESRSQHQW